jgi:hypothetical protein
VPTLKELSMAVNAHAKPVDIKLRTCDAVGTHIKQCNWGPLRFEWEAETGGTIAAVDGIIASLERVGDLGVNLRAEWDIFVGLKTVVHGPFQITFHFLNSNNQSVIKEFVQDLYALKTDPIKMHSKIPRQNESNEKYRLPYLGSQTLDNVSHITIEVSQHIVLDN